MLKLLDPTTIPYLGFRYIQKETNTRIDAPSLQELFAKVKSHRLANNLPIPLEWQEEVEQSLCEQLPAGTCRHMEARNMAVPVDRALTLAELEKGTKTIGDWLLNGGEPVKGEELERRIKICTECPQNQMTGGCTTCASNAVRKIAESFLGVRNDKLNVCMICGCSLKVAVQIPLEIIKKHDRGTIEKPSWCWQK